MGVLSINEDCAAVGATSETDDRKLSMLDVYRVDGDGGVEIVSNVVVGSTAGGVSVTTCVVKGLVLVSRIGLVVGRVGLVVGAVSVGSAAVVNEDGSVTAAVVNVSRGALVMATPLGEPVIVAILNDVRWVGGRR